ncbi:MAG: septum formation initiator family protein [Eubacteriales bacterium]|nr:septum formation initiator family protein [Eubacteriales bacterium]
MQIPDPRREGIGRGTKGLRLWRLGQKRLPFYVLLIAFIAILLMGWILSENYNHEIDRLRAYIEAANEQVFARERENLKLADQVRLAASDNFIANEARTKYGYIFPGEIRFVVTNPEVLGLPQASPAP